MANTKELEKITEYAVKKAGESLGIDLKTKNVLVGKEGKEKKFDGVSDDGNIVVKVINHGGYTSGGKLPSAKIKITYSDCYFLNLTGAKRRILAFTDKEFYMIFDEKSKGFLGGNELMYIELTDELKATAKKVMKVASDEMTK